MELKVSDILTTRLNETKFEKPEKVDQDFSFTLSKVSKEGLSERLSGMITDITAQGKKLSEHMDVRDMKQYRSMISEFMNEIVTNSHEFSRENFLDKRGRHRVYGIVKKVDENLDDLAQELLKSEKDNLLILEKTDEIRGMLLDLVV